MNVQHMPGSPLVRLFESGSLAGLSEWELLERFVVHRDELAFEVLVNRHGPMVLGTCRRMLADSADAEDAFQATFLVLLKRAGSLGSGDAIAGFLHGIAVRVASQARRSAARRRRREVDGLAVEPAASSAPIDPEVGRILDEEIGRLPPKYRSPVILCYLEGLSHDEAARRLSWPLGTVKGRLARARTLLGSRLARRGVASGVAVAVFETDGPAQAAVPTALVTSTCRAAARIGSGTLLANAVSTSVHQLVQGALSTMLFQKLKLLAGVCAVSGLFLTGAGVLARQQAAGSDPPPESLAAAPVVDHPSSTDAKPAPGTDAPSPAADPHEEIARNALRAYRSIVDELRGGKGAIDRAYHLSRLLMDAERDLAEPAGERLAAIARHKSRMQELSRLGDASGDRRAAFDAEVRTYLAEADLLLAAARSGQPSGAGERRQSPPGSSPAQEPGTDARSLAILARLEEPVDMSFQTETPLEDVLKYIRVATEKPSTGGIPFYVDPLGLKEAEKTLTSTVSLDLHGVPLRRSLQLALEQLGLVYFVDDGILVITAATSEQARLRPSRVEPSPFVTRQKRAEDGAMTASQLTEFAAELKTRKQVLSLLAELHRIEEADQGGQPLPRTATSTEQLHEDLREVIDLLRAQAGGSKSLPQAGATSRPAR